MQGASGIDLPRGPDPSGWYLVRLRPGGLARAETNLRRQGFDVFCPRLRCTLRRRDRFHEELRPLFPGYLFCRAGREGLRLHAVGATLGVKELVALEAGRPTEVPRAVVADLRRRCDGRGVLGAAAELAVGDNVRVQRGPLTDLVARVEGLAEADRVFVLFDLMGQAVRAQVSGRWLARA